MRQDETLRRAKRVQMIEEEKRKATAENTRKKLIKAEQAKAAVVRTGGFEGLRLRVWFELIQAERAKPDTL